MGSTNSPRAALQSIASHLAHRQQEILRRWHALVDDDDQLSTASSISRAQFYDHIPQVLDAFERRLCAENVADKDQARAEQKRSAAEHGLHRWQQGYNQSETMREWAHLQLCLLEELERYTVDQPQADPAAIRTARRALARLCGEGVCESAAHYGRLQQIEAAARLRELEAAVAHVQSLERERAELWREAAHDLRATVGVVSTAADVLDKDGIPEPTRIQMSQVLQRGTRSLRDLLTDLMDLSRLEAGQERRNLVVFDVAKMLRDFCEPLRALAAQRNLFLRTDGVEQLQVEGDPAKIQRVAQNLVMNALKATERGGIRATWEERTLGDRQQWILCVQDTGPGLTQSTSAPLERALKQATEESQEVEAQAQAAGDPSQKLEPAPTLESRSSSEASRDLRGEGIGLSIVKRLCELLDASLELETSAGEGTTFRVIFPRRYQS
jgi:signal transduction histidine kinase